MSKNHDKQDFRINNRWVGPADYLKFAAIGETSFHLGQSAEDTILLRIFEGLKDGFYVDVGAFHPRKYSNTFLLHSLMGWSGLNIDASEDSIKLFDEERPKDINVHAAVDSTNHKADYYIFDKPARNTISETNRQRQITRADSRVVAKKTIQTQTLEELLEKHLPKTKHINFLNVDVEGLDLEALQSNNWEKFRPDVVAVEDYRVSQGEDKNPIAKLLQGLGYRMHSHNFDTSIYVHNDFKVENGHKLTTNSLKQRLAQVYSSIPELNTRASTLSESVSPYKQKYEALKKEYDLILSSRSWRITKPLRQIKKRAKGNSAK